MNIEQKVQSLLTAANEATGESDTNLTDAISSLVRGQGGGVTIATGTITYASETPLSTFPNYIINHNLGKLPQHMFWLLTNISGWTSSLQPTFPKGGIYGMYADESENIRISNWKYDSATTDLKPYKLNKTIEDYFIANAPTTTICLSIENKNYTIIPAGSTLTWFVW